MGTGAVLALEPLSPVFNALALVLLTTFGDFFVFWMICSRRRLLRPSPFKRGSAGVVLSTGKSTPALKTQCGHCFASSQSLTQQIA